MFNRRSIVAGLALVTLTVGIGAATVSAFAGGRGDGPVIYVTGQDLYYDSIVLGPLPMKGPFQLLEMEGPTGLQTEFGPGDHGFVGGRWWVDVNGNGMMDDEDDFFSCPLLGPGRQEP